MVSSDACRICRAARRRPIPIEECTVEMLPPFPDCEIDVGCHSSIEDILRPEYGGPRLRRAKNAPARIGENAGCLGLVLAIILLLLLAAR